MTYYPLNLGDLFLLKGIFFVYMAAKHELFVGKTFTSVIGDPCPTPQFNLNLENNSNNTDLPGKTVHICIATA